MTDVEIEVPLFWERIKRFYDSWRREPSTWQDVDAVVLHVGAANDAVVYSRSIALLQWFFGYEFTETIMIFCEQKLYIYTSEKKVRMIETVVKKQEGPHFIPIEFVTRQREEGTENFNRMLEGIKASKNGKRLGEIVEKHKPTGSSAQNWQNFIEKSNLDLVDVGSGIAQVLTVKDATELKNIKTGATISAHILKANLLSKVEKVIDEETNETHRQIASKIEEIFADPARISAKLNPDHIDSCYTPLIMSGGNYDVKPGEENDEKPLHFGTIVCAVGARYKSYCSNVARTYLVDPSKEQKKCYELLVDIQQKVIDSLKVNTKMSAVYQAATKLLEGDNEYLRKHFGRNMGLEFQESELVLNDKNDRLVRPGMVFNVNVSFNNLSLTSGDERKRNYSLIIADTVVVKEDGVDLLTEKAPKKYKEVSYFLESEQEQEAPERKAKVKPEPVVDLDSKRAARSTQREDEKNKAIELEHKRREHQKMLEERSKEEAAARFSNGNKVAKTATKKATSTEAYKDPSGFPADLERNRIKIDTQREAILIPIYGTHVPFLISTIKNESKTDDNLIRINFHQPENYNPKGETDENKMPVFLKEITYRCPDAKTLNALDRGIKELRKRIVARESEKRETASLVIQEKLVLSRQRPPRLSDLFMRPNPGKGKPTGALEAHTNGFRFHLNKGDHVDVMYKNIKHAFFQPAENEAITLIHFHLHNGIMIGKKKVSDVQFCTEVMEVSQAIDSRGGKDEDEDPYREKMLRAKFNKEFGDFVRKVQDQVQGFEFDLPFRDLGFDGVPGRNQVFLQPTVNCLISVVEQPPFVLTLSDVEIASFERVQFSLKNFDVVFIMKDYDRPPIHINLISTEHLPTIKEWLDSRDIKYYEGPQSFNWTRIMADIKKNPVKFHTEDGGWSFLNNDEGSGDEEGPDSEEEGDENFSDEEFGGSDSEEDAFSDVDSDDDGDESGDASESEEDEEDDWDVMEERAKAEDARALQKRGRGDFSDDENDRKSKKSKTSSSSAKPSSSGKPPSSSAKPVGKPSSSGKPSGKPSVGKPSSKPLGKRAMHMRSSQLIRHISTPSLRHSSSSIPTWASKEAHSSILSLSDRPPQLRCQLIDLNQVTLLRQLLSDITCTPIIHDHTLHAWEHLVYFTPHVTLSSLGPDGSDTSYNPRGPFQRRMWAGGTIELRNPLQIGVETWERTTLEDVQLKKTRDDQEMIIVWVRKEFGQDEETKVIDRRSWLFRRAHHEVKVPGINQIKGDAPAILHGNRPLSLSQSQETLFRYSALTYNAHRIHLCDDWARRMEGQGGRVVHGPLNLSLLLFKRLLDGGKMENMRVEYRAKNAVCEGEEYWVGEGGDKMLAVKTDGTVIMEADVKPCGEEE
ncbi:FACT complex subunit SPT16 [Planoprotostelium fungivorum]|uniref:FACT complex subunit n=1 Tax=Planoprotostelium fungivorum TaxID=1890364 RepID=A0A2P6MWM4_9EUKA|nr:FACT complex subunit SPT16 [Planoprotostelium fungivorum]